jgi:predicted alpha/beta superfamily hydrolase
MKRLAVILWVATMVAGCQSPREAENESKVYLKNTEQFKLQSHEVEGEVNTAQVCLPFQFEKNKTYPVVYLLDANRYMDAVKGISDLLNYRMGEFKSHIQDIIVVGIIYNQSDSAWWVNRSRDFTPTLDTLTPFGKNWPLAGGADKFLDFIEHELHPAIMEKYLVDDTQTGIIGHSFGGLLAAYAFLTRDQLFDRYIVVSPCAVWDQELLLRIEEERFDINKDFSRRLYVATASYDPPFLVTDPTEKLIEAIIAKPYSNLEFYYDSCKNETHISILPRAVSSGLRFCYPAN